MSATTSRSTDIEYCLIGCAKPMESAAQNMAVLYLPNLNDRESLFKQLRDQEIEAGMQPLPLIVISGSPDVEIESRLVAGRFIR